MSNNAYTESWLVGPQSTKFYTRTYSPPSQPKAVVVFLHGFAEHIGRYTHFHPWLAAKGIAVFAYDQRGYGLTAQDKGGNKSRDSAYGKTSWKEQMDDIAWAVQHASKTFEGVPLFLMGHSMGGAEVLGFGSQGSGGPNASTLKSLSAIISTSPFIQQTHPAPKISKVVGGILSNVAPGFLIPAGVKAEHLSHDPAVFAAYTSDPLVRMAGSLKALHDMLSHGDWLLRTGYTQWPKDTPVFIIHGDQDLVTSYKASLGFHDMLAQGVHKKICIFEGGYHELQNEPDGVKEKLADTVIGYIEEQLSSINAKDSASEAANAVPTSETAAEGSTPKANL